MTKHIKLVEINEFTVAAINLKYEIFIVYIASLINSDLGVHLFCKLQIADLISEKASTMTVLMANKVIIVILVSKVRIIIITITSFLLLDKLEKV